MTLPDLTFIKGQNRSNEVEGYLITGGPVADPVVFKEALSKILVQVSGISLPDSLIVCEVSDEGYHHCHAAVLAKPGKKIRWTNNLVKNFKDLCTPDGKREVNCGAHHCPAGRINKGETTKSVLHNYCLNPKKLKAVDDTPMIGLKSNLSRVPHREECRTKHQMAYRNACILANKMKMPPKYPKRPGSIFGF